MANMKPQFLPLTPAQLVELTQNIRSKNPLMTGLNVARQPFRVRALDLENKTITAQLLKNNDLDAIFDEVTFNFNLNDNKYFFQGYIKPNDLEPLEVQIKLSTDLHWVHRRAKDRLIIPDDFYGVVKVLKVNGKYGKFFSRILNISPSGAGIEFKTENDLKTKDIILGELSFPSRPPIEIECEIVHRRESKDSEGKITYLFGLRYIFKKSQESQIMQDLLIDLFRDIFVASSKAS
jgi:hypothetical protein